MQKDARQVSCGHAQQERSLLPGGGLASWQGFPLAWVEADPHVAQTDSHTVSRTVLAMLDSGHAQAEFGYRRKAVSCDLSSGCIGLFAQGTHMQVTRWKWQASRRIVLEIDTDRFSDAVLLEQMRSSPQETDVEFRDAEISAVLRIMTSEVAAGCPSGRLYAESLSLGIAMRLHQRALARYGTRAEKGKLTAAQVRTVSELVRTRLGHDISLGELAAATGFSPSHFVRLFKNTLGCSPHQYLLRTRLARAQELVVGTDMPLATIADETGFSSQSHMTSAFARVYRVPPRHMRRAANAPDAAFPRQGQKLK